MTKEEKTKELIAEFEALQERLKLSLETFDVKTITSAIITTFNNSELEELSIELLARLEKLSELDAYEI
jgi:hypothetical protein